MYGPYKMVLISCIASLILIIGVLVYRYIYPKKKINLLALITLISILPVISIFRPGDYESGDFNIHIFRAIDFYNSLKDGFIMPSWAGNLNSTFGYPIFIFINPLPYYMIAFFHVLGFSFIFSMKLFLAISFILSGIFMYLWIKNLYKNELAAFTAGVFYLFTPYHLVDLHFRATVGEIAIFMTTPLLLLFITKNIQKQSTRLFLCISAAVGLVIISHQAMAVFSLFLAFLFAVYYTIVSKNSFVTFVKSIIFPFAMGLVLVSPYLLPYVTHSPYTILSTFNGVVFPPFQDLLYSPWRWGLLFQGPNGELSPLIGYVQIFIILASGYLLIKHKKDKYYVDRIFWLCLVLFFLLLITPISTIIWYTVPLIKLAIISSRMLLFAAVCISVLAALFVISIKKRKFAIYFLIFITTAYTILNWGHRRVIPEITDTNLIMSLEESSDYEGWGIGVPKWHKAVIWEKGTPKEHAVIISGKGTIKEMSRNTAKHTYLIHAETPLYIKENTWYFPGWTLSVNNKVSTIDQNNLKYINFSLPKGVHLVEVEYKDLQILKVAKIISLIGWTTVLLSLIYLTLSSYKSNLQMLDKNKHKSKKKLK